jgi:hypothetical protein
MTIACLKGEGKVDSERQRLRSAVIGCKRESKHDLRSQEGMMSREQEESGEARIRFLTSAGVVGEKLESTGGGASGGMCGEESEDEIAERSLVSLSEKVLRKAIGRSESGIEEGSLEGEERLRREFKEAQSLRGLLMLDEICLR